MIVPLKYAVTNQLIIIVSEANFLINVEFMLFKYKPRLFMQMNKVISVWSLFEKGESENIK